MNSRWLYWLIHGRKPARSTTTRRRASYRGPARDAQYRAFVRSQACCCCGTTDHVEAAHTKAIGNGGTSQKPSDYGTIPLCTDCHTQAPYSWHRDRAECERRIFARLGMTVVDVVKMLNQEWRAGRAEAA